MSKLPFIKFYPGDWLKDPQLSFCAPATRGVWIDLICAMHELGRVGELCGTAEQLARVTRCQPADFVQAITDLQTTGAADVTNRNGEITVRNRRMINEEKARKDGAFRQERFRHNGKSNGEITPYISEVRDQKSEVREDKEKNKRTTTTKFSKPLPSEVSEYAKSIGFNLDGQKFCDYYEAKGWVIGKSPMKSWKAAVRTWKSNTAQNSPVENMKKENKPSIKESWDKASREVLQKLEEAALSGGDAVSRCLSSCRDKYRDVPKCQGKDAINEAYEVFKMRNRKVGG
ncbi:MAG: hypothetical protein WC373_04865 [Smithella sp.]|jgi:hypothetical protein